jgi:hypothetical protein
MKQNELSVLQRLKKKHDIRILNNQIGVLRNKVVDEEGNVVDNPEKHHDLGNKSWGAIDFLVSCCGYRVRYVSSIDR